MGAKVLCCGERKDSNDAATAVTQMGSWEEYCRPMSASGLRELERPRNCHATASVPIFVESSVHSRCRYVSTLNPISCSASEILGPVVGSSPGHVVGLEARCGGGLILTGR